MAQETVESATAAAPAPDVAKSADSAEQDDAAVHQEHILTLKLKLPHEPFETTVQVSTSEQVQDLRQTIAEQPYALQYSCFHLEYNGVRMNDFVELSEIPGLVPSSESNGNSISSEDSALRLVEDPYNEKEARIHLMRVKELIGATPDKPDSPYGISYGSTLFDFIKGTSLMENSDQDGVKRRSHKELAEYKFQESADFQAVVPKKYHTMKTVRSISLSPWHPPPPYLKNKGHLLYLVLVNLDGDQFQITSHVSGFYLNRSSHNKFDPSPKQGLKPSSAHSLLTLLHQIDPKFTEAYDALSKYNLTRDPLQFYPIAHATPASPWLVSPDSKSLQQHHPDVSRPQETYLIGGNENIDNLRDWNEEFQVAKELPKESEAEKVFREKLTTKLYAEFTEAAVKGAVILSRGELAPLNPTEDRDAQIFIYNNVFFSFGFDGVGTFAATGGDAAARYATGKDVCGVRMVNQLDIPDLSTASALIVDYQGRRIVAQTIVPGIFKQREPHDSIDYGGVEGKDVIATKPMFVEPFAALAKATHVKRHAVWDAELKKHELETSIDTKGLLGTDGRKYALDLYKLQPLDVNWLERYWGEEEEERTGENKKDYPHRMAMLRSELVESYRLLKLREIIDARVAEHKAKTAAEKEKKTESNGHSAENDVEMKDEDKDVEAKDEADDLPNVDEELEKFTFSLNPDVFSGQVPQTDEERTEMDLDEKAVRDVCKYLTGKVIPKFVEYLKDQDSTFPLDGASFTAQLHKRGINVRYLGFIAQLAEKDAEKHDRMAALRRLAVQEMVGRSIKHVAVKYLRDVPSPLGSACMAHLLNCILGARYNPDPVPEIDDVLRSVYDASELAFESLTPASIRDEIVEECRKRFRYELEEDVVQAGREVQVLRDVSVKLGVQLIAREYAFDEAGAAAIEDRAQANGNGSFLGTAASAGGKRKKRSKDGYSPSPADSLANLALDGKQTFHADDVANFAPVIKGSCPKSSMAEDTFEAARISLAQNSRELGMDLLMQSLHIHEQVYSVIHPDVARLYVALSNIYYSLDDRVTAIELARKAVVIAERTIGLDSTETIQAYINLALFEHSCNNSEDALKYLVHAMDLQKLVFGVDHPDYGSVINNGAVMLQAAKNYPDSRIWFEACAELCPESSGVSKASILFQLAQALTLEKNIHGAVNRMRESASMFRAHLGPEDRNTKDAESWLEQLTTNAVNLARRQKDLASGRLKRVHFVNGGTIPGAGGSKTEGAIKLGVKGKVDERSIDELMQFIEGKDAKVPVKKSHRGNPKRRGGVKAGGK